MKLKPYPEYKDSGVPWLGKIPAHWELHRGKNLFKKMERPVRPSDEVVTCFRDGVVTLRKNRRTQGFTESLKEIGYQGIRKGDLIIHQMDAFAGAVGVSDSDGKGTPVYSVCLPKKGLNTHYYAFLVREMSRTEYITSLAKGIRERSTDFRFDAFSSLFLPVPSSIEQINITRFLRLKTAQITTFIKNKHAFIFLLKEQKQNIINRAVTRGLDENVPTKYSGIGWVGNIPVHWVTCRLRNIVSSVTSGSRGWSLYAADEGPLFIRIANLSRLSLELRFDNVVRLNLPQNSETKRTRIEQGDLLVSITAYIGSIAVAPSDLGEAYVSQHVARCSLRNSWANPRWLGYVLLSEVGQTHGQLSLYGGTKDGLSLDDVKNYPILLPPREEQDFIVRYLDNLLSSIDEAISRTEHEIELMTEYRTRLISDVVTGKVDVRDIDVPEISEDELLAPEEEAETEEGLSEVEIPGDEDGEADE